MSLDRKITPLKTIQGLVWEEGFKRGELQSEVFPDVPASFSEWHRKGYRVAIYSSGSVTAQRLVLGSCTRLGLAGNLLVRNGL
jgi:enolase-phosphatase E1